MSGGGVTVAEVAGREADLRALGEYIELIGLTSNRLGNVFADVQEMHATDFRAMTAVYRAERVGRPHTSKTLAAELDLSPAAISYVVDRLTSTGYVQREQCLADKRRYYLNLGESGRKVAAAFFGPLGAANAKALEDVSDDELAVATRVLGRLFEVIREFEVALRVKN